MSVLDRLNDAADLPAMIRQLTAQSHPELRAAGGTILDPRPGHQEQHPSFSVFRNLSGVWMWKRRGQGRDSGTAYHLLLAFGYSRSEALTCLGDTGPRGQEPSVLPPARQTDRSLLAGSLLNTARARTCRPASARERAYARGMLSPALTGTPAWETLSSRGLLSCAALHASAARGGGRIQPGSLAFEVLSPAGDLVNVKVRNPCPDEGHPRYVYALAGKGSPAWVNPDYGHAPVLLIIEGELNAAAAFEAAGACGRHVDVQGLAGADAWPWVQGLDREVRVYTDPDDSGYRAWSRLHDLLQAAGATSVVRLPTLPEGDYCDLLAARGPETLNALLDPVVETPVGPDLTQSSGYAVPGNWPLRQSTGEALN